MMINQTPIEASGFLPRLIMIPGTNRTIPFVGKAGDACWFSHELDLPLTALHFENTESYNA